MSNDSKSSVSTSPFTETNECTVNKTKGSECDKYLKLSTAYVQYCFSNDFDKSGNRAAGQKLIHVSRDRNKNMKPNEVYCVFDVFDKVEDKELMIESNQVLVPSGVEYVLVMRERPSGWDGEERIIDQFVGYLRPGVDCISDYVCKFSQCPCRYESGKFLHHVVFKVEWSSLEICNIKEVRWYNVFLHGRRYGLPYIDRACEPLQLVSQSDEEFEIFKSRLLNDLNQEKLLNDASAEPDMKKEGRVTMTKKL